MNLFCLFSSEEKKAVKEIKSLRKKIQQIENLGEGAIELKKEELKKYKNQIKQLKKKYPKDENVQKANLRSPKDKKFMGHTDSRIT